MNTPKPDDFQSYNGNHLVDDELKYSQEKKKCNIPICGICERLNKIDLATYVTKMYLHVRSHICLEVQS